MLNRKYYISIYYLAIRFKMTKFRHIIITCISIKIQYYKIKKIQFSNFNNKNTTFIKIHYTILVFKILLNNK